MKAESTEEKICVSLIKAFTQFRRLRPGEGEVIPPPAGCEKEHMRHSELMILFAAIETEAEYPEGISVTDLSAQLHVKPPSITPLIGSLEKKGMLKRSIDPNDRRVIRVSLREDGRMVVEHAKNHFAKKIHGLVVYLGNEKSSQLAELMDEVYRYFGSDHHRTGI